MKRTSYSCDGCGAALGPLNHEVLEYGHVGCVTARADLCTACQHKVEKVIGISWDELRKRNQEEDG